MLRMSALASVTFKLVCDRQAPPYVQTQETVNFFLNSLLQEAMILNFLAKDCFKLIV